MFTPQEIEERTFVKAVFGGYDMASVDDFLEPLTEDYIALYKENAVLKSKMKILVEKLEEYRIQEDSMKKALVAAQKTSDTMIAEAEKKCAQLTAKAEDLLRSKVAESQQQLAAEEERVDRAKQAARNFIEVLEKDVARHLEILGNLKLMNLGPQTSTVTDPAFSLRQEPPAPVPQPAPSMDATQPLPHLPEEKSSADALSLEADPYEAAAQEIAAQIEQNLEKVMGEDSDSEKPHSSRADKFADLQFGRNYSPDRE